MYTTSFTFGDATLTIRRATVWDRVVSQTIYGTLGLTRDHSQTEWNMALFYAALLTQTTIAGSLGITLPAPSADHDALMAGFEAVKGLPANFWDQFTVKVNEVDRAEEKKT